MANPRNRSLRVELLENRSLPSAASVSVPIFADFLRNENMASTRRPLESPGFSQYDSPAFSHSAPHQESAEAVSRESFADQQLIVRMDDRSPAEFGPLAPSSAYPHAFGTFGSNHNGTPFESNSAFFGSPWMAQPARFHAPPTNPEAASQTNQPPPDISASDNGPQEPENPPPSADVPDNSSPIDSDPPVIVADPPSAPPSPPPIETTANAPTAESQAVEQPNEGDTPSDSDSQDVTQTVSNPITASDGQDPNQSFVNQVVASESQDLSPIVNNLPPAPAPAADADIATISTNTEGSSDAAGKDLESLPPLAESASPTPQAIDPSALQSPVLTVQQNVLDTQTFAPSASLSPQAGDHPLMGPSNLPRQDSKTPVVTPIQQEKTQSDNPVPPRDQTPMPISPLQGLEDRSLQAQSGQAGNLNTAFSGAEQRPGWPTGAPPAGQQNSARPQLERILEIPIAGQDTWLESVARRIAVDTVEAIPVGVFEFNMSPRSMFPTNYLPFDSSNLSSSIKEFFDQMDQLGVTLTENKTEFLFASGLMVAASAIAIEIVHRQLQPKAPVLRLSPRAIPFSEYP